MSANQNDRHRYDDIIGLPHHVSKVHPPMPRSNRAAQFSPFAALTGFEAAVRETERLTEERIELDESQKETLAKRLQMLLDAKGEKPEVSITWFQPDERKAGGAYITHEGRLMKYDWSERKIVMEDGICIPIDDLYGIESSVFHTLDYA